MMSTLLNPTRATPAASNRMAGWVMRAPDVAAYSSRGVAQGSPRFDVRTSSVSSTPAGAHPLYDASHSGRLLDREQEITRTFAVIEPAMADMAATGTGDAERLQATAEARLGFRFPDDWVQGHWHTPVDMRRLYAYATFRAFCSLADRNFDRTMADRVDGQSAPDLIRKWGFHAIDVTPCADGRLSGVVDYILRIPPSVVASRKSFAGAMFDVEESVRTWADVELRRHRESVPNAADAATRYLKIGVYHFSGSAPSHEGCAAHGSDDRMAAGALLDRLEAFADAIENSYCCGATVATLLVGVDTDTDAIRVHVPDATGKISLDHFVDNAHLFEATAGLARDAAKDAIRKAVADASGVADDDIATEGMRWLAAYLLKNNIAQIDYVRRHHGGRYPDLGHTERFVTVGDSFDDVQMRNLAYQAQMETVEEGAADMDVGIKIFKGLNVKRGLPVSAFIHFRYSGAVSGSRDRAVAKALRLEQAIRGRYADLVRDKWLYTFVSIKDRTSGGRIEPIKGAAFKPDETCACRCKIED